MKVTIYLPKAVVELLEEAASQLAREGARPEEVKERILVGALKSLCEEFTVKSAVKWLFER